MQVSGTLAPDATGHYTRDELVNGRWSYLRDAGGFGVWWWTDDWWAIGPVGDLGGAPTGNCWMKASGTVEGEYDPNPGVTGTATVTLVV